LSSRLKIALSVTLGLIAMVAVGGAVTWWSRARIHAPGARTVLPVLSKDQLQLLRTYQRRCRGHADCEPPLGCVDDLRRQDRLCLGSECDSEHPCEPGFMCAPYRLKKGLSISLCFVEGTQDEGERCERFLLKKDRGCRPGLICNGGYCGRACDPTRASSCPDKFVCQDWYGEVTCLPSCLHSGCPSGTRCIPLEGGFSVCAHLRGQDCDAQACAEGEVCRRELGNRWSPQTVKMWCARPCDKGAGQPCPTGWYCHNESCARLCDENGPRGCSPGESCTTILGPNERRNVCEIAE
jgi:hypothetical protein